jgi:Tol biopolymer transport system component/DNA-binding SARP family transcriptional activator
MIRLRVLGPLELVDDESRELRAVLAQPKRLALLAYVAASTRGFERRDSLLAVFWPELDAAHGRDALNSAIRFLRRELGPRIIVGRGVEEVAVDRNECWCDADAFRALVDAARYEEALALYRGDLLPGFHPDAGSGFEEWLQRERIRLRARAMAAARAIAVTREREGDLGTAVAFAQRAVELSNLDERAVRELLELLDRLGDRAAALVAYDAFAHRMAAELDATPAPETRAVIERIRDRQAVNTGRAGSNGSTVASAITANGHAGPPGSGASSPTGPAPNGGPRTRPTHRLRVMAGTGLVILSIAAVAVSRGERPAQPLRLGETRLVSAAPELEVEPSLSPDGEMVAYASGSLGAMRIFVRAVGGGAPVLLSGTLPGDHRWPRWSPDGRRILFVVKSSVSPPMGALYIVPALGGAAPVVLSASDEQVMTPAWSADGTRIAYSDGHGILVRMLSGGPATRVVDGQQLHSPAFSPDGRFIAYVDGDLWGESVLNIAPSSIALVAATGGVARRLSDLTHSNRSPAWSADGRSVLYLSNAGGASDLHQQRLTRSGEPDGPPLRLTTGLGAATIGLSSDGSALVYSVVRRRSQIWSAPIPERRTTSFSEITLVTKEAQAVEGLDVSRDGEWLVYDSDRSGNQDIYKLSLSGGEPVQLTHHPAPDFVPQWSPDGKEVAYYSMRAGNRDLRVMSREGSDDQQVTNDPGNEVYPAWSPDGRELVFQQSDGLEGTGRLVTLRRDDARQWREARSLPGTASAQFPRWSPDGKWIAFVAGGALQLIAPSGDSTRTLVARSALGGRVHFAAWGRSSGVVYVKTLEDDLGAAFWEVPLAGAPPRLLLRLDDPARRSRRQEFATDGRRLFFTLAADEADLSLLKLER